MNCWLYEKVKLLTPPEDMRFLENYKKYLRFSFDRDGDVRFRLDEELLDIDAELVLKRISRVGAA